MRAVVQRVRSASVTALGKTVGAIGPGLLVLLGVAREDAEGDATYLAQKVAGLRVFSDAAGQMNLALVDVGGEILVVSQFTLLGDCRRGKRPSYSDAAAPSEAERLYGLFIGCLQGLGVRTAQGVFGAMMDVALVNDGPVTLLLDSRRLF
jgi:D-tyrosyl-tRNA(Tyr) deacylase